MNSDNEVVITDINDAMNWIRSNKNYDCSAIVNLIKSKMSDGKDGIDVYTLAHALDAYKKA